MCIRFLVGAVLFLLLDLGLALAQTNPVGAPADIGEGNLLSETLYSTHVRRADRTGTPPAKIPEGYTSAATWGAIGDGKTDDTSALQKGLDQSKKVWLDSKKVYRITKRLTFRDKCSFLSDGTATILMAAGEAGFSNISWTEDDKGIFSEKGTGLQLCGQDIDLQHFFLVKEYEDDKYVIGIEIVAPAQKVTINRLRIRGFSLAPGIITLKSAKDVTITNSIIHAAYTQSKNGLGKTARYQITGIVIDDQSPKGSSERVRIDNNVITDLWMKPAARGDQTDGINIHQNRSPIADNITITNNYINHVAEGIDIFAHNVLIEENTIGGREQAIKLIHGAAKNTIRRNWIVGKMSICMIGVWAADTESRQVKDILIAENIIDMRYVRESKVIGVLSDPGGKLPPKGIRITSNRFVLDRPETRTIAGTGFVEEKNVKVLDGVPK